VLYSFCPPGGSGQGAVADHPSKEELLNQTSRRLLPIALALAVALGSFAPGCARKNSGSNAENGGQPAAGANAEQGSASPGSQTAAAPASQNAATGQAAADDPGASRHPAPEFTLPDMNGRSVSLSQFRGKVVILDFWATWCPPCRMEIPHFVELQGRFQSKGLEIVGVSLDQEGAAKVRPFAQQNKINYTMLVNGLPITGMYGGISGIPTTFVLDKRGRVAQQFVGFTDESVFESLVSSLLTES